MPGVTEVRASSSVEREMTRRSGLTPLIILSSSTSKGLCCPKGRRPFMNVDPYPLMWLSGVTRSKIAGAPQEP